MELDEDFKALTGFLPFSWQRRLYQKMIDGKVPAVCDIPTGLGKTSVIPIWLVALAHQIHELGGRRMIPVRLVYVVDRRTVVDQATSVAEQIRERLSYPSDARWQVHNEALQKLSAELKRISVTDDPVIAISTLRGELADNKKWTKDPTKPAIIIGTIDMIGSKLLFNGYGDRRYWRSHHAGLIGQDSIIVHDEAHLTPAFSELLKKLAEIQGKSGETRPVRTLELSATSRSGYDSTSTFRLLENEEKEDQIVEERLGATKRVRLNLVDVDPAEKERDIMRKVREKIVDISLGYRDSKDKILVYVQSPEDALEVFNQLLKAVGGERVELLTGTMRGHERDKLVQKPLFQKFLNSGSSVEHVVYLVSTSAGEVGIDLDADHMVCDLTTLDSFIQRLGRVNRRGGQGKTAQIDVVWHSDTSKSESIHSQINEAMNTTLLTLKEWADKNSGEIDGSPRGLLQLVGSLSQDQRKRAFAPRPPPPVLTDILLDSWSLTSVSTDMPGCPRIASYLHGIESELPETYVVWRNEVKLLADIKAGRVDLNKWFEACSILAQERLRDRTDRVKDKLNSLLKKRRKESNNQTLDFPVVLLDPRGEALLKEEDENQWYSLSEITGKDLNLEYLTVILPVEAGGLGASGTLDTNSSNAVDVADRVIGAGQRRQRVVMTENSDGPVYEGIAAADNSEVLTNDLREDCRITLKEPEEASSEGGRYLILLAELGKLPEPEMVRIRQSLTFHLRATAGDMERICDNLQLEESLKEALVAAARWHDRGKNRRIWQLYANNNDHAPLAKSTKYGDGRVLGGYRHEFGSLLEAEKDSRIRAHPEKDLILHLIASHHGWARPHFETMAWDGTFTTDENEGAFVRAMQRFEILQQRFGRWGLAWLESLLRCADILSSNKVEALPDMAISDEVRT
jgi:CRISPR-associated endonuclease/helicase Cas3